MEKSSYNLLIFGQVLNLKLNLEKLKNSNTWNNLQNKQIKLKETLSQRQLNKNQANSHLNLVAPVNYYSQPMFKSIMMET